MPPRFNGDYWAICLTIGNVDRLVFRKINKKFFTREYQPGIVMIQTAVEKDTIQRSWQMVRFLSTNNKYILHNHCMQMCNASKDLSCAAFLCVRAEHSCQSPVLQVQRIMIFTVVWVDMCVQKRVNSGKIQNALMKRRKLRHLR